MWRRLNLIKLGQSTLGLLTLLLLCRLCWLCGSRLRFKTCKFDSIILGRIELRVICVSFSSSVFPGGMSWSSSKTIDLTLILKASLLCLLLFGERSWYLYLSIVNDDLSIDWKRLLTFRARSYITEVSCTCYLFAIVVLLWFLPALYILLEVSINQGLVLQYRLDHIWLSLLLLLSACLMIF